MLRQVFEYKQLFGENARISKPDLQLCERGSCVAFILCMVHNIGSNPSSRYTFGNLNKHFWTVIGDWRVDIVIIVCDC